MIRFEQITKSFKDKKVIKELTFEIEEGKLVTLIGGSGCGKTTTLKMINRLIKPTSGKIFIDGENIETKDIISLRRNMGYVIQQTGLFPHMTIRDNIEIIPKVEKRNSEDIKKRTLQLMEMVGLSPEEYLDRYPTELSGGQQQRIGVARAFATDPDIILMDEPFSALDPITRSGLQEELIYLQSQLKKTIVFVTHDMDEAIKISDKICIMDGGEILQYDTPEQILKYPVNDFVQEFVGKNRIFTSPEFIKAEDLMIDTAITCQEFMSLERCLDKMRKSRVDSLIVQDQKTKQYQGILFANQIRGQLDRSVAASSVMLTNYPTVTPDESMLSVLRMVEETSLSSIPVVTPDQTFCGLITKSSLITTLSQQYLDEKEA